MLSPEPGRVTGFEALAFMTDDVAEKPPGVDHLRESIDFFLADDVHGSAPCGVVTMGPICCRSPLIAWGLLGCKRLQTTAVGSQRLTSPVLAHAAACRALIRIELPGTAVLQTPIEVLLARITASGAPQQPRRGRRPRLPAQQLNHAGSDSDHPARRRRS